jgi:hypothetical protein
MHGKYEKLSNHNMHRLHRHGFHGLDHRNLHFFGHHNLLDPRHHSCDLSWHSYMPCIEPVYCQNLFHDKNLVQQQKIRIQHRNHDTRWFHLDHHYHEILDFHVAHIPPNFRF